VSVVVKIKELTHVPKVESSLLSVRYVMEITKLSWMSYFQQPATILKKQLPSKRNTNMTEENTNCISSILYNPIFNSTSYPNNSNNSQAYSQATLQHKNPIYTNNEHQNQQNENMTTQLNSFPSF
jgi:hypothetical protein